MARAVWSGVAGRAVIGGLDGFQPLRLSGSPNGGCGDGASRPRAARPMSAQLIALYVMALT